MKIIRTYNNYNIILQNLVMNILKDIYSLLTIPPHHSFFCLFYN